MQSRIHNMKPVDGDGFEYNLVPAKSGKAKAVMFIMHGYGGDVNQWNERALQASDALEDMDVISIQAPIELPHTYQETYKEGTRKGYAWANMENPKQVASSMFKHAAGGMPIYKEINKFIDKELSFRKLKPENACLVGCSLGGLIGVPAALSNDKPYGLVVGAITSVLPFSDYKSKPEVLLMNVQGDEHFDVKAKSYNPKAKGLAKVFNDMAVKAETVLNFSQGEERLAKHDVPYVSQTFGVHWEEEPLTDIQANPILDDNGKQKMGHLHHRVSVLMWSNALRHVGLKLGLKVSPAVDEMVAKGETGSNPQLTL